MRKHFLLLFLMALLPLAGWAEDVNLTPVNISELAAGKVVITVAETEDFTYNNEVQKPTITKVTLDLGGGGVVEYTSEWSQYFTVKYYKFNTQHQWIPQNANQIQDAGTYALTIVANGANDAERQLTYTDGKECDFANKVQFVIKKIDLHVTLGDGEKQYGDDDPEFLTVTPTDLTPGWTTPEFTWTGVLPIVGAHANVNAEGYPYNFPQNTLTGQTYVSSVNYNVFITNQPKLTVTKKTVALNYIGTGTALPSKTYGDGNETATKGLNAEFLAGILDKANYAEPGTSALVSGDGLETELSGIASDKVTVELDFAGEVESANADKNGNPLTSSPAEHKVKITIDESVATNYKFTVSDVDLTVKQAKLYTGDNAPFTFGKAETAPFTYKAAEQTLTKTITYTANNEKLLADGADPAVNAQVTVSYMYKKLGVTEAATIAALDTKAAGIYEAYVAPVNDQGNFYTESGAAIRVNALDFTINKRDLFLYVKENEITKTYQGSPYALPTYTDITFQGLIATDATTLSDDVQAVKAVVEGTTDETVTNAETYSIIPSLESTNKLNDNYAVQPYATTFKVSPLAITIDPKDMPNVVYGTAIAGTAAATVDDNTDPLNPVVGNVTVTKNVTTAPDIVPEDLTKVLAAYNVVVADKTYAANSENEGAITLVKKTLDETNTEQAAIINMLKNFDITEGTGNVTIAKGTYQIVVKTKNKTYGENYDWTLFDDYLTPGLTGNTKPASVKFILVNTATDETYSQNNGDALPKNAGTYTIKVDAANSNLDIENYTTPTEAAGTLKAGELTIATKELTFTTAPVKVNAGATKANLFTLGANKVTLNGLAYENDKILFDLEYVEGADGSEAGHEIALVGGNGADAKDMKAITPVDTYVGGYKVVAPAGDADLTGYANANYTITWNVTGTLEVKAANYLTISDDADVLSRIQIASTVCDPEDQNTWYTVNVDGRSLNADKWNVLVLPFDVTPYEFTQALGRYAVFNTLESVNTTNNTVSFKLQLNQLKANEPFLVKPEKLSTDVADGNNYPVAFAQDFVDRFVEYPTNGVPAKTNLTGVAFKGAYKSFDLDLGAVGEEETIKGVTYVNDGGEAGKKISYLAGGKFVTATTTDKTKSLKTLPVAFTRAYLDFNGSTLSNARILVEEADGTITAISEINAERVAANAEGWYTINGIKLQSAPVEKGVYINNGKKVVIK